MPAFLLHAVERPEPLDRGAGDVDELVAEANDHFEFYWFPHTDRALTKRNNRVPDGHGQAPAAGAGASGSTTSCCPTASSS